MMDVLNQNNMLVYWCLYWSVSICVKTSSKRKHVKMPYGSALTVKHCNWFSGGGAPTLNPN